MKLEERLAEIIREMPDGAAITVPVEWLRRELAVPDRDDAPLADLTVEQVARELKRSPSTVRAWCSSRQLEAYKFRGREWRISRAALRKFLSREANVRTAGQALPKRTGADLSAWRKNRRRHHL